MSNGSFAENQLKKYGWTKGQGLGKNAEGRKSPIFVTKKNDTRGLGNNSEDWSFEWWNKVYTKTLDNIKVLKTPDGEVKVSKIIKESTVPRNNMGIISTNESLYSLPGSSSFTASTFDNELTSPSNLKTKSSFCYGNFIKSSTGPLDLNGWNEPTKKKIEINNELKSVDSMEKEKYPSTSSTSNNFDMLQDEGKKQDEKQKRKSRKKRKYEDIFLVKNDKREKKSNDKFKKK